MLREIDSAGMARRRLPLGHAPFLQDLHFILPHHPLLLALILALLHLKHLWHAARSLSAHDSSPRTRRRASPGAKGDVARGGWGQGRGREARPRVQVCERVQCVVACVRACVHTRVRVCVLRA